MGEKKEPFKISITQFDQTFSVEMENSDITIDQYTDIILSIILTLGFTENALLIDLKNKIERRLKNLK